METSIPCSDDFRHPDGTAVTFRLLPQLFFGADGSTAYPAASDLRCHTCGESRPFGAASAPAPPLPAGGIPPTPSSPPLFIPTSVRFGADGNIAEVHVTGHYCSAGCRNLGLEAMPAVLAETYRLNVVLVDRALFGRPLDYTTVERRPVPALLDTSPPITWHYRLRGVRETWYGPAEGGRGRAEILRALREGVDAAPAPIPPPLPASDFAQLLKALPGAPAFRSADGHAIDVWPAAGPTPTCPPCRWCRGDLAAGQPLFLLPLRRDLMGTITLDTQRRFCTPGCGMAALLDARGSLPSRRSERVGLYVWICCAVLRVPYRARPRVAPHYLELDEFGGDLTRAQFVALEACEDFHSSLEHPPGISRRMLGNYARPGVVCDLSSLGSGISAAPSPGSSAAAAAAAASALPSCAMFDELLRDYGEAAAAAPQAEPPETPARKKSLGRTTK
jgi:hypothetical protein